VTVGSLFSGIGGIDLGLERAGMKVVWQVENNEFCRKALRKHWPGVKLYGDIREIQGNELEPVDLICGGFPCQDLSVAGKRAGLAGERSGLFYEFARIIDELAPRWVLIENVPGLLSSNGGRDMGAVLGTLAELGYGYAYRVLDAQYFGVAQRRRRVFIVGCFGDVASAAKVKMNMCPWVVWNGSVERCTVILAMLLNLRKLTYWRIVSEIHWLKGKTTWFHLRYHHKHIRAYRRSCGCRFVRWNVLRCCNA
jgi:DNA-cytosine methyltransferase